MKSKRVSWPIGLLTACGLVGACSSGSGGGGSGSIPAVETAPPRIFLIKPVPTATDDMAAAMTLAAPGDTIQFDCGFFDLSTTLQLINTENILIKGCGRDKTVLSFFNNNLPEGILAVNVGGLTVQDLTVVDTAGNGIELRGVNHGTLQRVRALWSSGGGRQSADPITKDNAFVIPSGGDKPRRLNVPCTDPATQNPDVPENKGGDTSSPDYTVSGKSGRYGIYPVTSQNILIEDSESIGASDAGIYVGQTNNAILRHNRAAFNVFGMEIENVNGGEYDANIAECNTGGFLIYDADGLSQYGDRSLMHGNIARNNNTYNFTAGGFVANVPPGSGMITLAYDRIDIFDNEFRDNNTGGIIHASYELFPPGVGRPEEHRIDWYTEGVHIFRNKFFNNGNGLPVANTTDMQNQDLARALPALVGFKNQAGCDDARHPGNAQICANAAAANPSAGRANSGFRGAHIVWDGLADAYDPNCPYPKDASGNDLPRDARGKPIQGNRYPDPTCHYNAYKFDLAAAGADKPRKNPDWFFSCIDDDNEYSADSLAYANFHGLKGVNAVVSQDPALAGEAQDFPSSFDATPHKCVAQYGRNLLPLPPVVIPPFVASGDFDPAPTEARIAELCGVATAAGEVNFGAAPVNCPTLDQYHLFADVEDPRSTPNGGGQPFSLNSKLFSDYAVKYRVAFLPPGTHAIYDTSTANSNVVFPTGTIIAKTFAFRSGTSENVVETRLLIKRASSSGRIHWDGMAYLWGTENGKRVARAKPTGGIASVAWDMNDMDSNAHYSGSTDSYRIPNANQCLSCHSNSDKEAGASPIGLKIRNLNGAFRPESAASTGHGTDPVAGQNQVKYWCDHGLLAGCPADLAVDPATKIANVERIPIYNKPGDSGAAAGSKPDIESRARAWLEVNCAHCHNDQGFASSTGLFLDVRRAVNNKYGICKHPVAAGAQGTGGRTVDIYPADPAKSVMEYRISSAATGAPARMPPLARSVVDDAGHALVEQWIRDVVDTTYPDSGCASSGTPAPPSPP
jgi:uncharacterized repeat protein (TIGR03806 family)